jgi:hypothetical protein
MIIPPLTHNRDRGGWVGRSPAYSLATVRKPKNHRVHHLHRVGLTRRDLVCGNLWPTGKFLKRQEVDVSDYPVTHDGRYFVVRERLWRKSNPALAEDDRQRFVKDLMSARRAVRDAKGNSNETAKARRRVERESRSRRPRTSVVERRNSRFHRHMVKNTPYADWYSRLANPR